MFCALYKNKFLFFIHMLSSASAFNLDCSKILLFDDKLNLHHTTIFNPLPDDKFQTIPNWKSLQTTISNLTKTEESYPNR